MREFHSEIEIDAPPERVWGVLVHLGAYGEWNPFIVRAKGALDPGQRVEIEIHPPGAEPMPLRPLVLQVTPGKTLRWLNRVGFVGLLDAEHAFLIEPLEPGRVRFVQRGIFRGFLSPFIGRRVQEIFEGVEAMNQALKRRAEEG
jgi:hypothetical protein